MLFDAHTCGFAALGGVARRGIYANIKTAVDRVGRGKMRIPVKPVTCSDPDPPPVPVQTRQ